ncbi:ankyrin repeat domain-containing protein [Vibrio cortegadensis]|uniref:Ankyrin repeat domain-containing protein n=1 Tax=Vibrio cortegadensis TaxID=1328770 RepID=A0ABV4M964_9VIBR
MKKIETPYITIQHLLREFSKALGTKMLAAKEIDNACKHIEINPHQLQELKKQLIFRPLSKHVNVYFADHVMEQIEVTFKQYIDIVKKVPLDGVNAENAQQLIYRHYMSIAVAFVCREMLQGMRTTPEKLANSGKTAMQLVFDNLKSSSTWRESYEKETKEQKDKYRIWAKGEHSGLPDITGISAIGKSWADDRDWGVIKARLVAARIWDYFFYRSGICDLDIIRKMNVDQQFHPLIESLQQLQRKEGEKYHESASMALELRKLLRLRTPKSHEDEQKCQMLLEKLHLFQSESDESYETTYFYHWMQARYHLYLGELDAALGNYKLAYKQSIYRAGENVELIIKEAMFVTARHKRPDKVFLNKLRSMGSLLNVDILPINQSDQIKSKPVLLEPWEISAYALLFESYFSKESFFPEANYPELYTQRLGLWLVDETKYKLDLSHPNKMFRVGTSGMMIKRMPQLVYFSINDDIQAIKSLIASGANVNKTSESNESALLLAIQSMQVNLYPLNSMSDELFKIIGNESHNESVLNLVTTKRKLAVLGCAVQTGRLDVVRKVVELGCKIDLRHDTTSETPLFSALELIARHKRPNNRMELSKQLWDNDQNLHSYMANAAGLVPHDKIQLKIHLEAQRKDSNLLAIEEFIHKKTIDNIHTYSNVDELREIAKFLIENGANPNAKHNTALHGFTPLMFSAELDEAELFYLMAQAGGDINDSCVNPQNNERNSCIEIATNWRSNSVLSLFKPAPARF